MREVAAVGEVEAQDGVAGLKCRQEDCHVRLRARVRLHVGMLVAEDLLHAIDGQPLGDIHELAAAVVALAGVALGIFVRQARTLCGHHGGARVVLAGDHFEAELLSLALAGNGGEDLGIGLLQTVHS